MATYYLPASGYYSTGQTTVRWRIKVDETVTTSRRSLYCTVLASRTDSYATTDARGSVTFYLNDVQQSSSSWAYGDKPIPNTTEVTMASCTMSLPLSTTSAKITATFSMPSINVGTQTNGGTISFSTSKIKLTLNPNGGSDGTSAVWYYYGVNTFYSDEACTNVITVITRPTRAGYTFVHYYGDGTCGGTADERYIAYDNIEFASDLCTDITKDATLYAKWSPNTYTVTYNANSGSGTMDSSTATYGQNFITNQNLYTRTGYTFNGWNESSDGTGTVWALGSPGVYEYGTPWAWSYDKDITLYAQWTPNTVHIAYILNGGVVTSSDYGDTGYGAVTYGGEPYFHSISYGSSADPYNAATFGLTKNGYTFAGWKVNSTGEILDQDTSYNSIVYAHYDDSSKTTENTENVYCYLNAQWTPNTYTVTYNANGGSGEMTDSIATYDSEFITRKNTFTKIGYTFNGWNEKADGTGTSWDLTSSGVYEQGTYWKWNYTNNITLYAQWKPNIIKLTLDKAGGTGGTDEIYYQYGINTFYSDSACTNVITTITRPTRTGYVFVHYAGDGTCGGDNGEKYIAYDNIEFASDLCTDITKDATLYAVWKSNADQDVYICYDTGKIYARSYVVSESFYINSGGDIYAPSFTVGSYFAIDANGITATEFIEGVPN